MTHYESVEKASDSRIAVNARMIAGAELAAIPVRYFDGAVSWKCQDRQDWNP
jgi:hypothetical protein